MSTPQTDKSGQIVKAASSNITTGQETLAALLQKLGPEIARALPRHITADRMARIALTALRTTKDLDKCTPASFIACIMSCAQLGLEPNTPLHQCVLIPRKNRTKGTLECTLIVEYQGQLDLSRRSGELGPVYAKAVRKGDEFRVQYGTKPLIHHIPSESPSREDQEITHVYAVAELRSGGTVFEVLSRSQVESRRARSAAATEGPWVTDYEAMALKTAIRALWKWLPKSAEMARAAAIEEAPESDPRCTSFEAALAWTQS